MTPIQWICEYMWIYVNICECVYIYIYQNVPLSGNIALEWRQFNAYIWLFWQSIWLFWQSKGLFGMTPIQWICEYIYMSRSWCIHLMFVCIHINMCVFVCMYVYTCRRTANSYVSMGWCIHLMFVCIHINICVLVYIHVYVPPTARIAIRLGWYHFW